MTIFFDQLKINLNQTITSSCKVMSYQDSNADFANPELLNKLLLAGLKNEWETAHLSMFWAQTEKESTLAMLYSRLAGDEAKHFLWIQELLQSRGVEILTLDQLNERSPLFLRLLELTSSFDRLVAGPFLRESLAVERNRIFLNFCSTVDASDVVEAYAKIQHDEEFHHKMGCELLAPRITTEKHLEQASEIVSSTMKIIDDIQEILILKKKLLAVPGC